jgi:ribosomal protein L37AE/L43A
MPKYLHCPHCDHPQIVRRLGKASFCRQCGWAFLTSPVTGTARPLPASTLGELRNTGLLRNFRPVYAIAG